MLSAIVYTLRDKTADAVLFMDRLDSYRVDASDVQARWLLECDVVTKTHVAALLRQTIFSAVQVLPSTTHLCLLH